MIQNLCTTSCGVAGISVALDVWLPSAVSNVWLPSAVSNAHCAVKLLRPFLNQNIQVKIEFIADECNGRNGNAFRNRKYASEEIRSQGRIY
jgi:hypothetical protein